MPSAAGCMSALKDYLKGLVAEEISDGTPVMRPLFYHYDEAEAYTEKTEYLLGRDLLVAPVYEEGARAARSICQAMAGSTFLT